MESDEQQEVAPAQLEAAPEPIKEMRGTPIDGRVVCPCKITQNVITPFEFRATAFGIFSGTGNTAFEALSDLEDKLWTANLGD